jgi:hypothetical protein
MNIFLTPKKFECPSLWNRRSYEIKNYGVNVTYSLLNFIKIYQLAQKLMGGGTFRNFLTTFIRSQITRALHPGYAWQFHKTIRCSQQKLCTGLKRNKIRLFENLSNLLKWIIVHVFKNVTNQPKRIILSLEKVFFNNLVLMLKKIISSFTFLIRWLFKDATADKL